MKDFVEKMRLKGMAEEDVFFAKQDAELIDALQKKKLAKLAKCSGSGEKKQAEAFEERFEALSEKHKKKPRKLLKSYRDLLDDIKDACRRRDSS
jgi:hypothetical protein